METIHEVLPVLPRRSASLRPNGRGAPLPLSSSPGNTLAPRPSTSYTTTTTTTSIPSHSSSSISTEPNTAANKKSRDKSYRKRVPPPLPLLGETSTHLSSDGGESNSGTFFPSFIGSGSAQTTSTPRSSFSLDKGKARDLPSPPLVSPRTTTSTNTLAPATYSRVRRSSLTTSNNGNPLALAIAEAEERRRSSASSASSGSQHTHSSSSSSTVQSEDRRGSESSTSSSTSQRQGDSGNCRRSSAPSETMQHATLTTSAGHAVTTSTLYGTSDVDGFETTKRARTGKVHILHAPTSVSFVPTNQPQTAISVTPERIVIDTIYPPTLSSCAHHDHGNGTDVLAATGRGGGANKRAPPADVLDSLRDHEAALVQALQELKPLNVDGAVQEEVSFTVRGTTVFPSPTVGARVGMDKDAAALEGSGATSCPCICCTVGCTAPSLATANASALTSAGIEMRLAPLPTLGASAPSTPSSMPTTPTSPLVSHAAIVPGEVLPPITALQHSVDPTFQPQPYKVRGDVVTRSVYIDPSEKTTLSSWKEVEACSDPVHRLVDAAPLPPVTSARPAVAGTTESEGRVKPPPRRSSKLYALGRRGARSNGSLSTPSSSFTGRMLPSQPPSAIPSYPSGRQGMVVLPLGDPGRGGTAERGGVDGSPSFRPVALPSSSTSAGTRGRRSLDSSLFRRTTLYDEAGRRNSGSTLPRSSVKGLTISSPLPLGTTGRQRSATSIEDELYRRHPPPPPPPPLPSKPATTSRAAAAEAKEGKHTKRTSTLSRLRRSLSFVTGRRRSAAGDAAVPLPHRAPDVAAGGGATVDEFGRR